MVGIYGDVFLIYSKIRSHEGSGSIPGFSVGFGGEWGVGRKDGWRVGGEERGVGSGVGGGG